MECSVCWHRVIYRSIALATNDEWAEQAQRMVRAEAVRWL
jgi:alkylated DNA nucleotide flippase Atl1